MSSGVDKDCFVWETATFRPLRRLKGHEDLVNSVCLSLDGKYACSGSNDKTVKIWDVFNGQCLHTLHGHTAPVHTVCLSHDGRYLLSASEDKTIKLWFLDWELEDRQPSDWEDGARPFLETFLTNKMLVSMTGGLTKRIWSLFQPDKPTWTNEDFKQLIYTLGCAGYGWLRPEGVRRELEKMAAATA